MGIVKSVRRPDFHKQTAPPKPISTGGPLHLDKQSGVQKTTEQKSIVVSVVSKGHAGDVER